MAGMSSPNSPTYTPSGTTPTAGGKGPASTTTGGYGAAPTAGGKGPASTTTGGYGSAPATKATGVSETAQPSQQAKRGDGRRNQQQRQQQGQQGQQGNQPFQQQQFLNNIQQGTGALGGSGLAQFAAATGQQFQQPTQAQLATQASYPDYSYMSGAPNQTPTAGQPAPSADMSSMYGQFNQAQNQQGAGSQSAAQPAGGGFMSGTGGGTTGGMGGGRGGKGFRSGGAVREISQKEINQILNALRVAREVVIKGK
jgi:hypothetical protein